MSFNISESLREFIRKLVKGKVYKNSSAAMRSAIVELMNSYSDVENLHLSSTSDLSDYKLPTIVGNVMIIVPKNVDNVERKLAHLETNYKESIMAKNCFFYRENKTLIYIFDGTIEDFQKFLTEINNIDELINIRYIIL
ncbi:MAG: ribbon-helix-helix domain-containing protein [Promethearchaeota archaeon]